MIDEALEGVRRTEEGVEAVVLAGCDGVVVATAGEADGIAPDAIAAAFADLFRRVGAAHRDAGLPQPREVTAGNAERRIVIRAITDDYLLLAVLGRDGILGRARHALLTAAERLEAELR